LSYALNRYNSGVTTSSNQFNTSGRLPYVEHRVVSEKPLVWQPHAIYFIKPLNQEISEHYWVDASGVPHPVGDAVLAAWRAIPGNKDKTAAAFLDELKLPTSWRDAVNDETIIADGKYSLVAGNVLMLDDIGEGNQCWIRLADETASWLPQTVTIEVPLGWTTTRLVDPGPGSIVTIICHSAAKQFTFQR
jgi:hypothetical protein